VLKGKLIPRGELGDDLVVDPWKRTLQGRRPDISVVGGRKNVVRGKGRIGRGVPDGNAHGLSGTFGPGPVVLEAEGHVVGVRWQALVEIGGRGGTAVEGARQENGLGVLVQHLVVSAVGVGVGGRGTAGGEGLEEGGVVN
jgi:hypothetical protein